MRDLAKDAYDACQIGSIGWMRPDSERSETIEGFQAVVKHSAPALQEAGLIEIKHMHTENQTGQHLVDAIKFLRLK